MFGGQAGQKLIGMDFGEHETGSASERLLEPAIVVFVAGREAASSCGPPFDVHERASSSAPSSRTRTPDVLAGSRSTGYAAYKRRAASSHP